MFRAATTLLIMGFASWQSFVQAEEEAAPGEAPPVVVESPAPTIVTPPVSRGPSVWASAEYLNWWIRPGPMRTSIVAAGDPLDPVPGAIGQPGTRVLFGNDDVDFGAMAGVRIMAGAWFDNGRMGAEIGGFCLFRKSGDGFSSTQGVPGSAGLYIPAYRPDLGREGAVSYFDPVSGFSGNLNVTTEAQLCGAEANLLNSVLRNECVSVDVLCGVRYLQLNERLREFGVSSDLILFNTFTSIDEFNTRNQFLGGQVGAQGTIRSGWFFANIRGTFAAGANYQTVELSGNSQLTGTATGNFVGGFFTQPSNVGRRTECDLSFVPQASIKLGFNCFGCATVFAGYDCLYWYRTVRPGDQIDRRVDTPIPLGGLVPVQPSPTAFFNQRNFWAHGVSVGIDLRY
jgi:hypothetical protein